MLRTTGPGVQTFLHVFQAGSAVYPPNLSHADRRLCSTSRVGDMLHMETVLCALWATAPCRCKLLPVLWMTDVSTSATHIIETCGQVGTTFAYSGGSNLGPAIGCPTAHKFFQANAR